MKTKYKIEGDTLKIFNLADSIWEGRKILSLSKTWWQKIMSLQ